MFYRIHMDSETKWLKQFKTQQLLSLFGTLIYYVEYEILYIFYGIFNYLNHNFSNSLKAKLNTVDTTLQVNTTATQEVSLYIKS